MTDPHPMQKEYDRTMAEPRFQARKLSIGWAVTHQNEPTLQDNGTMSMGLRFPVLVASELLEEAKQEKLVSAAAKLLEESEGWDH